jgi:TetR/AcrR family fatty acid metabolism transcriptional regulator
MLKLIFGTIDQMLITWLVENRPADPREVFDDLFDLFIHAIEIKKRRSVKRDKRSVILDSAVRIFSELGYSKTGVHDIAKSAGVGISTIYKYFSSKEELLFSLATEKTQAYIALHEEHLNGLMNVQRKIDLLIKDYLDFVDSDKEYASIFSFDLRYNKAFYQTDAYSLFRKFARIFYDSIVEGIEEGYFRSTANPYLATKMIFGVIDHLVLSWIITGKPVRFANLSDSILSLILSALKK